MNDRDDLELRDHCTAAVRDAMKGMRPDVLVEMANEDGPTDLTPFAILALAVLDAAEEIGFLVVRRPPAAG